MQPEFLLAEGRAAPQQFVPVFSRVLGSWQLSLARATYAQNDLARHYDRQSQHWHRTIERHHFGTAYRDMLDRILHQPRYRQEAADLRVLDAGIGTGAMAAALRAQQGRRFRLDGIDISTAMLAQAHARLCHEDIDLTLARADLTALPFADSSFDVVLAAHVIEHLPDPDQALREIFRVLKPGGVVICCMTRRSVFGLYIQLVWRTHKVALRTGRNWVKACGFRQVRAVPFRKGSATRRFSIGYVGRKPL